MDFKSLLWKKMINEKFGKESKQIPIIKKGEYIYIPLDIYSRSILKEEGKGIYFECGLVKIEGKIYRKFKKGKIKYEPLRRGFNSIRLDDFIYIDTDSVGDKK